KLQLFRKKGICNLSQVQHRHIQETDWQVYLSIKFHWKIPFSGIKWDVAVPARLAELGIHPQGLHLHEDLDLVDVRIGQSGFQTQITKSQSFKHRKRVLPDLRIFIGKYNRGIFQQRPLNLQDDIVAELGILGIDGVEEVYFVFFERLRLLDPEHPRIYEAL